MTDRPNVIGYGGVRFTVTARDEDGNQLLRGDPSPVTGQQAYLRRDAAGNLRPWTNTAGASSQPLDPPGGGWWTRVSDDRPMDTPHAGWEHH